MIESALRRLASFSRRRYTLVFALTAVVSVLALASARNLRFDTQILNLLPPDDPDVHNFLEAIEDFGSLEHLLVVVRLPEDQVVDPYLDFIDQLGPRLEQLPQVETVEYSLDGIEELIEEFFPRAFLLLDDEGRARALERLSDQGIETRVRELRRRIETPQAMAMRSILQLDPLGLSELLIEEVSRSRGSVRVDWSHGNFLSQDNRLGLLVVRPTRPAMDAEFARELMLGARAACDDVLADWEQIAGPDPPPPPQVDFGGSYATIVEDAGHMTREVVVNVAFAMVGVLVLFALAFRRIGLVFYAFLPLVVGLVLGFGFAGAAFGQLSAASSGFAALLIGLALDFVIVSYSRYVEERQGGADLSQALEAMAGTSGRAVVTGAITTAATFYAFAITDFPGLRQMGILTGTGILLCLVAVLVLLPALLAWSEDRHYRRLSATRDLSLHAFGLGRLVSWSFRNPIPVLVAASAITLGAAVLAPRLRFEDDIRKLRPTGSRAIEVQTEVARSFGSGFDSMMLMVDGSTEAEVLELVRQAEEAARPLVEAGVLTGTESLASLIPSAAEQAAGLAWLREHADLLDGPRLRRVFAQAASEEGLRLAAFDHGIELLAAAGATTQPMRVEDLAKNHQTELLLERYYQRTENGARAVVYLMTPPQIWSLAAPPQAVALAERLGPHVTLTGANLVGERLRGQIRSDAVIACGLGLLFVGTLLYLEYRRAADTLLSLLPLCAGIVWMFAGMVLLDLDMNFFNIFVTTMIIGIGVDYGIHMVNRWREHASDSPPQLESCLCETGRAVVLAALSTMVGFGSLALSSFPGIRSIGLVAILGALATAAISITVLPALFALTATRRMHRT